MPLYDISCTQCGAKFEKQVPFQANYADVRELEKIKYSKPGLPEKFLQTTFPEKASV